MTNEETIVSMQMSLSAKTTFSYYLFEGLNVTNGGVFFGCLLLTVVLAGASEGAAFLMRTKESQLNCVVFAALRILNYTQMLVVMTYNIWMILVLVIAQALFAFGFRKLEAKQSVTDARVNSSYTAVRNY